MQRTGRPHRSVSAWLIGLVLLALAALPRPAGAADTACREGNQAFQPGQTLCLNGFTNTCQPNGAWISDRQWPCMAPVFPTDAKSCTINANQTAAPGTRACIDGRRRECSEHGTWISLGVPCN
ncbi:MAG TPA: hypothetical protein VMB81_07950 [Candidatus Sulfotelmatobacter sp.]|nr:hypothetical protein [Candidatus Sulfotelmatobacter sp.]